MKKLIDELEAKKEEAYKYGDFYAPDGLDMAISIVRAHSPWHEVTELPPHYEQDPYRSIEILILTADGNIYTGVYVFEEKLFIILNRRSIAKEIGWTYLPGLPK